MDHGSSGIPVSIHQASTSRSSTIDAGASEPSVAGTMVFSMSTGAPLSRPRALLSATPSSPRHRLAAAIAFSQFPISKRKPNMQQPKKAEKALAELTAKLVAIAADQSELEASRLDIAPDEAQRREIELNAQRHDTE